MNNKVELVTSPLFEWTNFCKTFSEEALTKRLELIDISEIEQYPLIDKNYEKFIKNEDFNIEVDSISLLNFTGTIYEYFTERMVDSEIEDLIKDVNYLIFERKFTVFPFMFIGLLSRSSSGYGRGGNEFHEYLEENYSFFCDKEEKFQKIYSVITYIMKYTDYHYYPQDSIFFSFLLLDQTFYDDIDKTNLNECYKFISAFNETKYKVKTLYPTCYDDYRNIKVVEEIIKIRKQYRLIVQKLMRNKIGSSDIINIIFDFLVDKVFIKNKEFEVIKEKKSVDYKVIY